MRQIAIACQLLATHSPLHPAACLILCFGFLLSLRLFFFVRSLRLFVGCRWRGSRPWGCASTMPGVARFTMQAPQRFSQHLDLVLGGRFFTLGLFQGAQNLLNLIQHSSQLRPYVENLVNGFADARRNRLAAFLGGWGRLLTTIFSLDAVRPFGPTITPAAAPASTKPPPASAAMATWFLAFGPGVPRGLRLCRTYRIFCRFLCIHRLLPAKFPPSGGKINANKRFFGPFRNAYFLDAGPARQRN